MNTTRTFLQIPVTADDKARVNEHARKSGVSTAELVRDAITAHTGLTLDTPSPGRPKLDEPAKTKAKK